MTASGIRLPQAALVAVALAAVLAVDVRTGFAGQAAIGLALWALLSWLLGRVSAQERRALMLLLGVSLARHMPESVARAIIGCAAIYALAAAAAAAFYCALDALVAVTALLVSNGFRQPIPQGAQAR